MNQQLLHITFESNLSEKVKRAIHNVFENFTFFLKFNDFNTSSRTLLIGVSDKADLKISNRFVQFIEQQTFEHELWFDQEALLIEDNLPDYIGSCFYMINCLQEYADYPKDFLGRFTFESSYQYRFNCAEDHLVLKYFQEIAKRIYGHVIPLRRSMYSLSHDIDFLHRGWNKALKKSIFKGDIKKLFQLAARRVKGEAPLQNLSEIISDEKQYEMASIFFFLPVNGASPYEGVSNADYTMESSYVQEILSQIKQSTWHNLGLHKSIGETSFADELKLLQSKRNRFHYLKFQIPEVYQLLEQAEIDYDYSLGFSTHIGFRNSYGLPYKPFNPLNNTSCKTWFIPLLIMDSSMHYFMGLESAASKFDAVQNFIHKHKESTVISLLWHNDFYEHDAYIKLLAFIRQELTPFTEPQ